MLKPCAIVELVWQDETGSTAATTLYLPSSLTVSEIDVASLGVASILASLTGCVLIKQRIKYINVEETRTLATDGSPIVKSGLLYFSTPDNAPLGFATIHAFKDAYIVADGLGEGVLIDTEDSTVIALINAIHDLGACTPFGDTFGDVIAAYIQSRV